MVNIGRWQLVLLLVGCDEEKGTADGVKGITRLQKLLFLLEQEDHITPSGDDGFEFTPYDAGPYSSRLYDDLELLENLDLIESKPIGASTEAEAADIDVLDFDHLMGETSEADGPAAADAYQEHHYLITDKGRAKVEELLARADYEPVVNGIRKLKSRFGKYSLQDLLYYVYTRYPNMTTESKIREKVLSRR